MFVGTFEGAVGACMFVLVHLNKNGYFKGISRANNICSFAILCERCGSVQRSHRLTAQQRRIPCRGSGVSFHDGFLCASSPHCTCST